MVRDHTASRRRRAARWAGALALLLSIGLDVAADSRCHPTPTAPAVAGWWATPPAPDGDACADTCVPDCYCCSTLSVGPRCAQPEFDRASLPLSVPGPRACAAGVHPSPYRPPLVLR